MKGCLLWAAFFSKDGFVRSKALAFLGKEGFDFAIHLNRIISGISICCLYPGFFPAHTREVLLCYIKFVLCFLHKPMMNFQQVYLSAH